MYARVRVVTESTGAVHGDETVTCAAQETCLDKLTLAVSHTGGHLHTIASWHCGYDNDGGHNMPDDLQITACSPWDPLGDFHLNQE